MSHPSVIYTRVQGLHRALLQAGWADRQMARKDLEGTIIRTWGVSAATARVYIDTGRSAGFWESNFHKAAENAHKLPHALGTVTILPDRTSDGAASADLPELRDG